jgi:hypothetical protein
MRAAASTCSGRFVCRCSASSKTRAISCARAIIKAMGDKWNERVDQKTLYDLFPLDPSKQGGPIAGLPEIRRKGGYWGRDLEHPAQTGVRRRADGALHLRLWSISPDFR